MNPTDDVLNDLATVEIKELPATANTNFKVRTSKKIQDTAIALLEEALESEKTAQDKIVKSTYRAHAPVKAVIEAFQNFEKAIGGRAKLIDVLQHCPSTSHGAAMVSRLIEDPDFLAVAQSKGDYDIVRYSLAAICNRHKIPFNAIVMAFKDARTAEIAIKIGRAHV